MDIQLSIQERQHRTLINIDINSAENVNYIVTLLRSLNFIKKVEVVNEDTNERNESSKSSRFARFYGAASTGLSAEVLEQKLDKLRDEWERNI